MKPSPDLVLLPGRESEELWRLGVKGGQPQREKTFKRAPHWVGLPTRSLISLPVRLNSSDRQQQEGSVQLELEAAGMGEESVGAHRFDLFPSDPLGKDTVAAVFVSDGTAPVASEPKQVIDSHFVPAVCFRPLVAGVLSFWREAGRWVMAVPHASGRPVHVQGLSSFELDADAAAEVRCVLAGLELQDVLPALAEVVVEVAEGEPGPAASFGGNLELPVSICAPGHPVWAGQTSRLLPDEVLEARHQRRQLRVMLTTVLSLVLVVAAALAAFGAKLYLRDQELVAETARLDGLEGDLEEIRQAQQHWEALKESVNPDQYAVELFYQLVTILPEEGIRVTRFELRGDSLIIAGEASSVNHAISFRGDLTQSEYFKEWGFDQGFAPTELPDRRASFRAEGQLNRAVPEETAGGGLVGAL